MEDMKTMTPRQVGQRLSPAAHHLKQARLGREWLARQRILPCAYDDQGRELYPADKVLPRLPQHAPAPATPDPRLAALEKEMGELRALVFELRRELRRMPDAPSALGLDDERTTIKPEEAGPLLGVGRNGVYELLRSGQLRSIKVGRKILIPKAAIDEFLAGSQLN